MKPSWRDWIDAIGKATFSERLAGQVVYLAIDEEEIARIGRELGLDGEVAYESFRRSVAREVEYGWPCPMQPRAGEFPRYLPLLAAQVVAAFGMHDDERASSKAYWRRLREFLDQQPEDRPPDGLDRGRHQALWRGLRSWANEANGGRYGLVRLAGKTVGHRHVAEPLGQCLLRRADLERIRSLFAERGSPDPEPYAGRRLRELVDDARHSLPGKYFTRHGLRVLDDTRRFDAAWRQIEDEYRRFLAESHHGLPARPGRAASRRPRPSTAVLLEIGRRGLVGGLFTRDGDGLAKSIGDVGELLRRCYLRSGREGRPAPHKPPHDAFLLATRDGSPGAFAERRTCRAGQEVLLLVPEWAERTWLDAADPRLFEGIPRRYRPPHAPDRDGWFPLEGLPGGWLALAFKTRDDLTAVELDGKWIGAVDRRATGVRAQGGLLLRRGVWMLGVGPTLRAVGPATPDYLLVDGERHGLDASRCVTPDLGVGEHRIRLPGPSSRVFRVRVEEPRRISEIAGPAGWHRVAAGWPASSVERRRMGIAPGAGILHGPLMAGDWPAHPGREAAGRPAAPPMPDGAPPDALGAMLLGVRLRSDGRWPPTDSRLSATMRSVNPLIRAIQRADRRSPRYGRDET